MLDISLTDPSVPCAWRQIVARDRKRNGKREDPSRLPVVYRYEFTIHFTRLSINFVERLVFLGKLGPRRRAAVLFRFELEDFTMCQEEHQAAVAAFIRNKGVTRCPTACALPTQGSVPAADRAALEAY